MTTNNYAVVVLNQVNDISSVNVFTNVSEDDAIKYMKEIAEKVAINFSEEFNDEAKVTEVYYKNDYELDDYTYVDYVAGCNIESETGELINIFLKEVEFNNTCI